MSHAVIGSVKKIAASILSPFLDSHGGQLPCGHDVSDYPVDFLVNCPECYQYFFRRKYIPFSILVGLFSVIVLWHPFGMAIMMFAVLVLVAASYVSAVLRRRPQRLLVALTALASAACLVLAQSFGDFTEPLTSPLILVPLVFLSLTIAVAIGRSIAVIFSDGVPDASPILAVMLMANLVLTVANASATYAVGMVPSLDSYVQFAAVRQGINVIQRYRLFFYCLIVSGAMVWAIVRSFSAARSKTSGSKRSKRSEVLRFIAFGRIVSKEIVHAVWHLFKATAVRSLMAAWSCVRVLLLIATAWLLAIVLHNCGGTLATIWERRTFWPGSWHPLVLLAVDAFFAYGACWAVVIISLTDNKRIDARTWRPNLSQGRSVAVGSLLLSTSLSCLWLMAVLACSSLATTMAQNAMDIDGGLRPPGAFFAAYLTMVLAIVVGDWLGVGFLSGVTVRKLKAFSRVNIGEKRAGPAT